MRVAVVDIGTNTVRCLVADENGELGRTEHVTGLGRGVDATGRLGKAAIARTIAALDELADAVAAAQRIRVVATSASRDAANREEFFDQVEKALGHRPELLSGSEEAALSYAGATPSTGRELRTVVDLGGGSTEVITGTDSPRFSRSYDIGSVRITDRHFQSRPASASALAAARRDVQSTVTDLPVAAGRLVGVGGTFQTLGSMLHGLNHGVALRLADLDGLVEQLASLSIEETGSLDGVVPGRDTVILGGAVIAAEVVRLMGATEVQVSRFDLLDGMAASLLAQSHPE